MEEANKTYRIRTTTGITTYLPVQLDQTYDILEVLSLKIDQRGAYNLHSSNYGVVVGRAIANGGVGVPNAKISIFINKDENDTDILSAIYPYVSYNDKGDNGIRYNLLTDTTTEVNPETCQQVIGSFPSKRMVLDNDNYIEVFDKYYKFTTRTNDSGDYMIFGVPTGNHTLHMDLDISDCGILSQRPRDFVYKGYNIEQFENPNQFKEDTEIDSLAQVFTQNQSVDVKSFWGDADANSMIGITRADINVNFKFETTCVFMGSVFTDDANNGISRKCVPSKEMGKMDKLTTGRGTIEIIRKTPSGEVEELSIKGTDLIDGNGVWCFQIPMNLDYMMTDEYGNLVATDDPDKGIATRARVRFRISMGSESDSAKFFQTKVLLPNNPSTAYGPGNAAHYTFGSATMEEDYRDMFWNCVYSVKSYIPRIQRQSKGSQAWRTKKFSGIKTCNAPEENNPFPFNHIRLRFPFLFTVMCALVHMIIWVITAINKVMTIVSAIANGLRWLGVKQPFSNYVMVKDSLCPDMSGTFVIPGAISKNERYWNKGFVKNLIAGTYKKILGEEYADLSLEEQSKSKPVSYSVSVKDSYMVFQDGDNNESIAKAIISHYENGANSKYLYIYWSDGHEVTMELANAAAESFANSGQYVISAETQEETKPIWWTALLIPGLVIPSKTIENMVIVETGTSLEQIESLIGQKYKDKDVKKKYNILKEGMSVDICGKTEQSLDIKSTENLNRSDASSSQEQICLTNQTDYLMQCVEMNLAEEYEVINFDFYNDWINGAIYMPRWARRVRRIPDRSGNRIRACFNDGTFKKQRYLVSVGDLRRQTPGRNEAVVQGKITNAEDKWNDSLTAKSIFGDNGGLIDIAANKAGLKAYYFKPCEWSGRQRTLLFATDLVLLGHLDACNIFGIPQMASGIDATSYRIPPDLAETNLSNDESEYKGGGCYDVKSISKASAESLYRAYINGGTTGVDLGAIVDGKNINEELVSATEEAGISWEYTGPNQLWPSTNFLFSPGGHFLALACTPKNSSTNAKSIINAARMCEAGVTTSQRKEIEYELNGTTEQTYYMVPTGLISKDEIIDNSFRRNFATMNFNGLKTEVDPQTGYLRYRFQYSNPMSFDGGAKSIVEDNYGSYPFERVVNAIGSGYTAVSSTKEYSDKAVYNVKVGDVDPEMAFTTAFSSLTSTEKQEIQTETANTYTRTWEDFDEDYYRYRLGIRPEASVTMDKEKYTNFGGIYGLPQYENSFYFYFGLKDGNTAIDRLNTDFFATCAKSVDAEYKGQLKMDATGNEYGSCNGRVVEYQVTLEDVAGPYKLNISRDDDPEKNLLSDNWRKMIYAATENESGHHVPLFAPERLTYQDNDLIQYKYKLSEKEFIGEDTVDTYFNNIKIKLKYVFDGEPEEKRPYDELTFYVSGNLYEYGTQMEWLSEDIGGYYGDVTYNRFEGTRDAYIEIEWGNENPDRFTTGNFFIRTPNTKATVFVVSFDGYMLSRNIGDTIDTSDIYYNSVDFELNDYNHWIDDETILNFGRGDKTDYYLLPEDVKGYINISGFDRNAAKKAIEERYQNGMAIVIIDSTGNNGHYGYYGFGEDNPDDYIGILSGNGEAMITRTQIVRESGTSELDSSIFPVWTSGVFTIYLLYNLSETLEACPNYKILGTTEEFTYRIKPKYEIQITSSGKEPFNESDAVKIHDLYSLYDYGLVYVGLNLSDAPAKYISYRIARSEDGSMCPKGNHKYNTSQSDVQTQGSGSTLIIIEPEIIVSGASTYIYPNALMQYDGETEKLPADCINPCFYDNGTGESVESKIAMVYNWHGPNEVGHSNIIDYQNDTGVTREDQAAEKSVIIHLPNTSSANTQMDLGDGKTFFRDVAIAVNGNVDSPIFGRSSSFQSGKLEITAPYGDDMDKRDMLLNTGNTLALFKTCPIPYVWIPISADTHYFVTNLYNGFNEEEGAGYGSKSIVDSTSTTSNGLNVYSAQTIIIYNEGEELSDSGTTIEMDTNLSEGLSRFNVSRIEKLYTTWNENPLSGEAYYRTEEGWGLSINSLMESAKTGTDIKTLFSAITEENRAEVLSGENNYILQVYENDSEDEAIRNHLYYLTHTNLSELTPSAITSYTRLRDCRLFTLSSGASSAGEVLTVSYSLQLPYEIVISPTSGGTSFSGIGDYSVVFSLMVDNTAFDDREGGEFTRKLYPTYDLYLMNGTQAEKISSGVYNDELIFRITGNSDTYTDKASIELKIDIKIGRRVPWSGRRIYPGTIYATIKTIDTNIKFSDKFYNAAHKVTNSYDSGEYGVKGDLRYIDV